MTMGTNEPAQTSSRSRTRSSKRDVLIYGLGGAVFALLFVMALPTADTSYFILGTCVLLIAAVVYVAKAIIALRRADDATSDQLHPSPRAKDTAMSTSTERFIIALAFGVALVNFFFMGMDLLYYVCLVVVFVVCGSSLLRRTMQRRPVSRH